MTAPRYRLTGRLESGELAELFEATGPGPQQVVVKLFHSRTSDPRYARAIADTARRLDGIPGELPVRVLEVGFVRERLAIVRENVEGYTLGQALQRLATREVLISPALALSIVLQLLEGVQRAHEAGVVHGAITPGNVLLGREGRIALTDFGALAALSSVPELRPFASRGRGVYRAPEVTQGEAPQPVSDVYSLGAIAWELLTLREPALPARTVSTRHEPLPPPSRLDRRINARLDPVVMRALDPSVQRRFRGCADFAGALRNFLTASGGVPGRAELVRLTSELFPREVQLQPSPQLPFAEPFSLEEVTGATALPVPNVQRTEVLRPRPSFTHTALSAPDDSRSGAETIEAMPAFAATGEGTSPGAAGPLEHGWDAPPGEAPPPRAPPGGPAAGGLAHTLRGRVRVVEDFSEPSPPPRPPEPSEVPTRLLPVPPPASEPVEERPEAVAHETSSGPVTVPVDPRRRGFLYAAVGTAVVGAVCFALVLWQVRSAEAPPLPIPMAKAPTGAPATPELRTEPVSPASPAIEAKPEPARHVPPHRNVAYLSVSANVPAAVFIDGRRVSKTTPLRRYKVEAGRREIVLESQRTGERRTLTVSFPRGRERKFYERFQTRGR